MTSVRESDEADTHYLTVDSVIDRNKDKNIAWIHSKTKLIGDPCEQPSVENNEISILNDARDIKVIKSLKSFWGCL